MTGQFQFKVKASDGDARTGALSMPRGEIRTPAHIAARRARRVDRPDRPSAGASRRSPVSACHALATAGAKGGTPGSPTPAGARVEGTI